MGGRSSLPLSFKTRYFQGFKVFHTLILIKIKKGKANEKEKTKATLERTILTATADQL